MELARRVRRNILLKEADNLAEKNSDFKERIKVPFMNRLFWEIDNAMQILTKIFWHLMHLIHAVMRIKKKKLE